MTDFDALAGDPLSRRAFLARMTAAGLGAAAAAFLAGCGGTSSDNNNNSGSSNTGSGNLSSVFPGIPGSTPDVVVLNYALTLETIEADLYRQAVYLAAGRTLAQAQDITQSPELSSYSGLTQQIGNGGLDGTLAPVGFAYLQQYAPVEAAHRDFLKNVAIPALGGTPVQRNALGYTTTLPSTATLQDILNLIRTVEATGTTAYLGAAGYLSTLTLIQTASTIYSTEARHTAGINFVLGADPGPTQGEAGGSLYAQGPNYYDFQYYNTPATVISGVQKFIVSSTAQSAIAHH